MTGCSTQAVRKSKACDDGVSACTGRKSLTKICLMPQMAEVLLVGGSPPTCRCAGGTQRFTEEVSVESQSGIGLARSAGNSSYVMAPHITREIPIAARPGAPCSKSRGTWQRHYTSWSTPASRPDELQIVLTPSMRAGGTISARDAPSSVIR